MKLNPSKIKVSRELFWGTIVSLLYITIAVSVHQGYVEDFWYYFMIGGFIGAFIITSFSKKNLKNNMKSVLAFGLILAFAVYVFAVVKDYFSEGYFLFENYVDWKEIYSYYAMGTVSGLFIKWIRDFLLKLKK